MAKCVKIRALVLLLSGMIAATMAANTADAGGWVHKFPTNLVKPESGHRNHVFYAGEPVKFELVAKGLDRFEVRNYWGKLIQQGPIDSTLNLTAKDPGWYKLYIYAKKKAPVKPKGELDNLLDDADKKPKNPDSTLKEAGPVKEAPSMEPIWGDCVGGTNFVIFRRDKNFPDLPDQKTSGGSGTDDQVLRGVVGMGPQRHSAHAAKLDETIAKLDIDVGIDKKYYLPFDPARLRSLMMAFPDGTKDLDSVRKIVEHFHADVKYFEPRNEPNYGSSGADFVTKEARPFYDMVKSVDPQLKVLGPGTVSIGPNNNGLGFIEDFFKAGGARYIDAFSFHAYNNVNGDIHLGRRSLDALDALLKKYDADKFEKWQTEQGYMACVYGSYQPRLQGRWTMVEMMVFEQYGIPKEHNHLWYDRSHGFWDVPTWWENDDESLNPAAPLMRVFSEELFGTRYVKALDFGEAGNRLYLGNYYEGKDKRVAAFLSAGSTDGQVELAVKGAKSLKVSSAFGVESDLPVKDGRATLTVPELPVYVDLAPGQEIEVVPTKWGENLALADGVVANSSGAIEHPHEKGLDNPPKKFINGVQENWYYAQKRDDQPWMSNVEKFPAWVEVALAKPTDVARVIVYAAPPWQLQGSLLDYELQYDDNGKWVTLEHVKEPPQTFKFFTASTRTSVDSFYSDRWVFQHHFKPVKTGKIRLLVNEVTWGGGATPDVCQAGGQTGLHQITLREIEIYGPGE